MERKSEWFFNFAKKCLFANATLGIKYRKSNKDIRKSNKKKNALLVIKSKLDHRFNTL